MKSVFLIVCCSEASNDQLLTVLQERGHCVECSIRHDPKAPAFDASRHAGLIIMGDDDADSSDMDVYGQETKWLGEALEAKKPVLGICHGAQLLAVGLGAREDKRKGFKDRGMSEVYFTAKGIIDPLTKHLVGNPLTLQWHQHSHTAPACADLLLVSSNAARPHCEAFRLGTCVYGLQFHPEVSCEGFRQSGQHGEAWEPVDVSDEVLRNVCATGKRILEAWVDLAVEVNG